MKFPKVDRKAPPSSLVLRETRQTQRVFETDRRGDSTIRRFSASTATSDGNARALLLSRSGSSFESASLPWFISSLKSSSHRINVGRAEGAPLTLLLRRDITSECHENFSDGIRLNQRIFLSLSLSLSLVLGIYRVCSASLSSQWTENRRIGDQSRSKTNVDTTKIHSFLPCIEIKA